VKKRFALAFLAPSIALAVDFDLRPLDKGGNADMTMFSPEKALKNPKAFLGKSVRLPLSGVCISQEIAGFGLDGKLQNFEGLACSVRSDLVAITGDLKVRDSLRDGKIKEIVGTIVGINETNKIIVKPTDAVPK